MRNQYELTTRRFLRDEEFTQLPRAHQEWWARVFTLMQRCGVSLDLAYEAVREADRTSQEQASE